MRRALLLPVLLLLSSNARAGAPPTRAALRKAFEANRATVVEVVGPRRAGTGVLVGSSGKVLTSVDFVQGEKATVRREGKALSAKVRLASAALKVALVEIDPPGEYPSTAVRLGGGPSEGDWLVAIAHPPKGGEPAPVLAQVARAPTERSNYLEVLATLPRGAPLFDDKGRLVALVVGGSRGLSRALPVPRVKDELAAGTRP